MYIVYLLVDEQGNGYVGSSMNFKIRYQHHKTPQGRNLNQLVGTINYFILERDIPDKLTALEIECKFVQSLPNLTNKNYPVRQITQSEYKRKWKERNRCRINKYRKNWYNQNKTKQKIYHTRWMWKKTTFGGMCNLFSAFKN